MDWSLHESVTTTPAKWGYATSMGAYVVNPQFDLTEQFSEGLAVVRIGDGKTGKWATSLASASRGAGLFLAALVSHPGCNPPLPLLAPALHVVVKTSACQDSIAGVAPRRPAVDAAVGGCTASSRSRVFTCPAVLMGGAFYARERQLSIGAWGKCSHRAIQAPPLP